MFKDNRTEGRLRLLVESESLFNDGVAAVLFTLVVTGMQATGDSAPTWMDAGRTLLVTAGGGIAIGLACAALAVLVVGRTIDHLVESTLTTVAAYGSFLLAERFHVSGVPSTVTAGLVVGSLAVLRDDERSRMTQRGREFVLALWPELTNWPSGTHKGTYPERPGGPPAEIRQTRVPAIDGPFGGDNGKQVISVRPPAPAKSGCFRPKKYTTNGVGMGHCTETRWERFSAHAGRLHARLDRRRRPTGAGPAARRLARRRRR
jgi:hypothetical protein